MSSSLQYGRVVACVIENRAREVGLAVLEPSTLTLRLSQFIEPGRSYAVTQMLLQLVCATEVVVVVVTHREREQAQAFHDSGLNRALLQTAKTAAAVGSAAPGDRDGGSGGPGGGRENPEQQIYSREAYSVHPLPRSCFDDTQGGQLLAAYANDESQAAVAAAAGRASLYLALGAAGALLHHVLGPAAVAAALGTQAPRGVAATSSSSAAAAPAAASSHAPLRSRCLRVEELHSGLHLRLDGVLAAALEIVQPSGPTGRSSSGPPAAASLLRLMGRSLRTRAGARLLRSSLLQPLADVATLNMRYDTIEELMREDSMAFDLGQVLALLPRDLDKMCYRLAAAGAAGGGGGGGSSAAATGTSDPGRGIGSLVQSLLLLRDVLALLTPLGETLEAARSPLLVAIRTNCCDPGLGALRQRIDEVLDEEATAAAARGAPFVSRVQQCFAVRPDAAPDGLLELARGSLCRLTEAVHELGARYAQEMGLSGLKVSYSARKGFYLTLPAAAAGAKGGRAGTAAAAAAAADAPAPAAAGAAAAAVEAALPPQLLVLERRGRGALLLTSHELNALNARLRDATNDCLLLTRQLLEGVVSEAFGHMGALQRLVDSVALLDLVVGLADLVANGPMGQCCRPQLRLGGPLAIVQGRHPLLAARAALQRQQAGGGGGSVQPNDTFISPSAPLHLIAGPNMSGKSTYLQQVALLVVMAQAGCWVPAEFCSLSPFTALMGRLGGGGGGWGPEDDLEAGSSSFLSEMQDAAAVLSSATPRSLVLLDELGRATSTADGVGLAWAICEELMTRGSSTLLATHFPQLGELAVLYPQARLWRLQVDTSAGQLDFRWLLQPAAALDYCHYGLMLAEAAGMPPSVVAEARRVAEMLEETERRRLEVSAANGGLWAAAASVSSRLSVLAQQWRSNEAGAEVTEQALVVLRALRQKALAVPLGQLQQELREQG